MTTIETLPDQKPRGRAVLVLLFGMFALPVVLAVFLNSQWFDFRPSSTRNLGVLVEPARSLIAESALKSTLPAGLQNNFVLVVPYRDQCDTECQQRFDLAQHIRVAMGKEVNRVGVAAYNVTSATLSERHDQLGVALNVAPNVLDFLPAELSGQIFLLDPRGFVFMRYDQRHDGTAIRKDLALVLKYSPLGKD
jgi:hypothetical protein